MKFGHELTFWVLVAVGITLFAIPFKAFMKVAVAKLPSQGLQEAFAS